MENYTDINSEAIDRWVEEGWEWGQPITHETYAAAVRGEWDVLLTPTKPVPHKWFCDFKGAKILGLASGGGQQMPIFSALGADCTVFDYSKLQLESEKTVSQREGYEISIVRGDMTKPFPFPDDSFDLIFHPVANCYIEEVTPVWRECYRVLKKGGILLAGLDNGINFLFDENDELQVRYSLPFNPLKNKEQYEFSIAEDYALQFSHPIEEQIGGQLKCGFTLTDIYEDTNNVGLLHDKNVPVFYATRAVK